MYQMKARILMKKYTEKKARNLEGENSSEFTEDMSLQISYSLYLALTIYSYNNYYSPATLAFLLL